MVLLITSLGGEISHIQKQTFQLHIYCVFSCKHLLVCLDVLLLECSEILDIFHFCLYYFNILQHKGRLAFSQDLGVLHISYGILHYYIMLGYVKFLTT